MTVDEINQLCKKYDIENYHINDDMSIDVDGNVALYSWKLTKIPLKFGKVTGAFACNQNQLTSLEGCPYHVGDTFFCYTNKLTNLVDGPSYVGGDYVCHDNPLITFEGSPNQIGGHFVCNVDTVVSFEHLPSTINASLFMHTGMLHKTNRYKIVMSKIGGIIDARFKWKF